MGKDMVETFPERKTLPPEDYAVIYYDSFIWIASVAINLKKARQTLISMAEDPSQMLPDLSRPEIARRMSNQLAKVLAKTMASIGITRPFNELNDLEIEDLKLRLRAVEQKAFVHAKDLFQDTPDLVRIQNPLLDDNILAHVGGRTTIVDTESRGSVIITSGTQAHVPATISERLIELSGVEKAA